MCDAQRDRRNVVVSKCWRPVRDAEIEIGEGPERGNNRTVPFAMASQRGGDSDARPDCR
jgi:hypothetical protein